MKPESPPAGRHRRRPSHRARGAGLLALGLTLASQAGCGREFFREWADQDVSEAVFEKSRDPRFRLDLFSIEPPSLSRFVDPYDPDRPPAPPDDLAAEALSPVPQWPDHRLVVPVEGTGYLGMLEMWRRQLPPEDPTPEPTPGTLPIPRTPEPERIPGGPRPVDSPIPPPSFQPGPFDPSPTGSPIPSPGEPGVDPSEIPGPRGPEMTPNSLSEPPAANRAVAGTRPSTAAATPATSPNPTNDNDLRRVEFQDPATTQPDPARRTPADLPPGDLRVAPPDDIPSPSLDIDPDPINQDLSRPLEPDAAGRIERTPLVEGSEMAGILSPEIPEYDEARAAGLPSGSLVYRINPAQALTLALINSRAYQTQIEAIYLASLAVTQQRFAFEPQFVAGISPLTSPAGAGLPSNPANQFFYRTREAPGGQASSLSLGQVAGFGKLFMTGGRLLGAFASQTVFNFVGNNPQQPTVQSTLPLSFVQPFLRAGGRAVTLEPLTQAERNLLYQVRLFTRFRQQFFVSILVGQAVDNAAGGVGDPAVGFLQVLQSLQQVEIDRRNVATFDNLLRIYARLAEGEPSGIAQLQVDQVDSSLQGARQQLANDELQFRNQLDQFKQQLGLPPDVPLVLDRALFAGFTDTFNEVDRWGADPKREFETLERIVGSLPSLEDVVIDGRSVLEMAGRNPQEEVLTDKLEDILAAAVRVAFENRVDLMNARAALYDSWRQLKVTANGLLGVFNVAVTNQILTPAATTNPFAFVDQAKQFQLVINAELPLVRVVERNAFRQAWINYQRQRRALMFAEDSIKFQVRQQIRQLETLYITYNIQKRNLVLNIRQKDQAQENILAPPAGAAGQGQTNQAATQTINLTNAQRSVAQFQLQLSATWLQYQTQRLALYRDLGIMPYDEWEAYYELFPSTTARPDVGGPGGGVAAGPAAAPAGGLDPAAAVAP